MSEIKDHEKTLASFIGGWQLDILLTLTDAEEYEEGEYGREFFIDLMGGYAQLMEMMPKNYEQGAVDNPIAYLHYSSGNSHWYILERDSNPVQRQAYGFAVPNGDSQNAEFGYIDIDKVKRFSEFDLYFEPTPITEIMENHGCQHP